MAAQEAPQVAGTDTLRTHMPSGAPDSCVAPGRSCSGAIRANAHVTTNALSLLQTAPVCSVHPTPESHKPGLPWGPCMARGKLGAAAAPSCPCPLQPDLFHSCTVRFHDADLQRQHRQEAHSLVENLAKLPLTAREKTAWKTGQENSFSVQDLNQTWPQQWRQCPEVRGPCVPG